MSQPLPSRKTLSSRTNSLFPLHPRYFILAFMAWILFPIITGIPTYYMTLGVTMFGGCYFYYHQQDRLEQWIDERTLPFFGAALGLFLAPLFAPLTIFIGWVVAQKIEEKLQHHYNTINNTVARVETIYHAIDTTLTHAETIQNTPLNAATIPVKHLAERWIEWVEEQMIPLTVVALCSFYCPPLIPIGWLVGRKIEKKCHPENASLPMTSAASLLLDQATSQRTLPLTGAACGFYVAPYLAPFSASMGWVLGKKAEKCQPYLAATAQTIMASFQATQTLFQKSVKSLQKTYHSLAKWPTHKALKKDTENWERKRIIRSTREISDEGYESCSSFWGDPIFSDNEEYFSCGESFDDFTPSFSAQSTLSIPLKQRTPSKKRRSQKARAKKHRYR